MSPAPQTPTLPGDAAWRERVLLTAFDVPIELRTNRPGLLQTVWKDIDAARRATVDRAPAAVISVVQRRRWSRHPHWDLFYGDRWTGCLEHRSDLAPALDWQVVTGAVDGGSPYAFLHAGVVGWKGRAIVLPGASGSGKSTLVAALVQRGATHLTDEIAAVGPDGRVVPFPRPMRHSVPGSERKVLIGAEALGGTAGTGALPIGLMLFTRYRAGAVWEPRRLSAAETVVMLLRDSVVPRSDPERAMQRLERVVRGTHSVQTDRDDVAQICNAIVQLADDDSYTVPSVSTVFD